MYTTKPLAWNDVGIDVLGIYVTRNDVIEANYAPTILKTQAVLNAWFHRNLSIVGKVLVVNSLVASLFVHKMLVLPSMPIDMVKSIEGKIVKFIWNNKKAKIKLRTLQNPKKLGGLNLVSLRLRDLALKCTWIQILEQDEKFQVLATSIFSPIIGCKIFECNLHPKDIMFLIDRTTSPFWYDMLYAWFSFYFEENAAFVRPIWWNSCIRIAGKPIFWQHAMQFDLYWPKQVLQEPSSVIACAKFCVTTLEWNALVAAISRLRCKVMEENKFVVIKNKVHLSGYVYKSMQERNCENVNPLEKWGTDLCQELTPLISHQCFCRIYVISNASKLRSFQFRLLHKALILNLHLYRWGILSHNRCSFCDSGQRNI